MKKWIVLTLLLGALFAVLSLALGQPIAADPSSGAPYDEQFTTTTYRDSTQTTALWDTAAGRLRLHAAPSLEYVIGQLYYPSAWSAAAYVPDTGRMYLFGGAGNRTAIQEYDPQAHVSRRLAAELPFALEGAAAVYAAPRHAIYVLGGDSSIVVLDVRSMALTVLADKLPTPLSHAAAVYAPQQDKAYLFGGQSADGTEWPTILEYDLAAGTVVTLPVTLPQPMSIASAVYDPASASAYIFGGQAYGEAFAGVIKFDVVNKTIAVVGSLPRPCSGTSAAYVPEQRKAYIFGGMSETVPLSQTVAYDVASNTVTALPVNILVTRNGAAAAYVPSRGAVYVLGGQFAFSTLSDMVAFDVNSHAITQLYVGLDGNSGAAAIYAPDAHKAYLFGGQYRDQPASHNIVVYDVNQARVDTLRATLPVSRTDSAAVYVPATNQAYIFGGWQPGQTPQYFADILRFNVAAQTVTTMSSVLPAGRAGMAAVYVPSKGKAYLFGGEQASGASDEILVYNPAQDQLTPLSVRLPISVAYSAAIYYEPANTVYLIGGKYAGREIYLRNILAFDVASETVEVVPGALPELRARAVAVAVPAENRIYVIGGIGGWRVPPEPLDSMVSFDITTGVITYVQGVRLGEPRYGEAALSVPETGKTYLFGGSGLWEQPLPNILVLQSGYARSEMAQSLRVNAAQENVRRALLEVDQLLQGGSVSYFLSNDGGQHWASVRPGMRHFFSSSGSDLRWRAVLNGSGANTPWVNRLTISYDDIAETKLFLPVVLRGYPR